jgi:hypothetical protein
MKRHAMDPSAVYNIKRWRDILFIRRVLAELKQSQQTKLKDSIMRGILLLFISLSFIGCGASRAHTVQFNNTSDITLDKKYVSYFEEKIAAKTSAKFITYKITTFTEGSRAQRALFWVKGGEARVTVSISGLDPQGNALFAKNESAECAWGFTGGSVYSCLTEIAGRLP